MEDLIELLDMDISPDLDPTEYVNWHDTGCELSPHCLSCPFPLCVHDLGGGGKATARSLARQEAITQLSLQGWNNQELSRYFGVTMRTIQRALKE